MPEIFLSLGSNLGDSKQILKNVIEELGEIGTIMVVSSFYKTEPVGLKEQPWFLNCVVKMETSHQPLELLHETQKIENNFGRERNIHWGPRTLDIDILFFGDVVMETEELTLPHPRLHERRFVLEPLCEIAADQIHPVLKKTIQELTDLLVVKEVVEKI